MDARRAVKALAALAVMSLAVMGCASDQGASLSPAGSPGETTTSVQITLEEWAVGTVPATAPAGAVTFNVTNQGPDDLHEFVVIKTDLSFIDLPTDATGAVDEAAGGMEVIGEIEDIAVGATEDLAVTLEPGAYALICNVYDETEQEAHYQEGMRASFTVTE